MAAKKLDPDKLILGTRKDFLKSDSPPSIETAVKKIHDLQVVKEPTVRITIDVPKGTHNKIRMRLIELDEKFISSYILDLNEKDLNQ